MTRWFTALFDTSGFVPRWDCGDWSGFLGWTHIMSDVITWGSYTAIPVMIAFVLWRRKNIVFPRIGWLFAAFILACGTVHLVEAIIFWYPVYRLSGFIKAFTAAVSLGTALATLYVLPYALRLPGILTLNADLQREIAQRRQSEKAEERARKFTQSVLDSLPVQVAVIDADGKIIEVNRAWREFSNENDGIAERTCVGANYLEVCNASSQGESIDVTQGIRDVLSGNRALFNTEYPCDSPTEPRWFLMQVAPLDDSEGAVIVHSNITTRKIAEERARGAQLRAEGIQDELEERESRLQLILDSTAEAIYGIDMTGKCTFCNPACARMLGYNSPQDLLGRNMHNLIHYAHEDGTPYAESECRIFVAFRKGEGTHADSEVLWRKDGTCFPVEYWSYPVRRGNEVIGSVVTFLDITERREEQEYEARLAALVDSSYDAIIGKDVNGIITSWNDGAEGIYGYSEDEAIGKTIALIFPDDTQEEELAIRKAIQSGQRLDRFETARRRKDGRRIQVALTVSPIADANGRVIGTSTIERDITDRKLAEEELRKAKETAELAREAAERANRARGEFLANVSHELRTPMNAIIGMTQIALHEPLSDEVREYIETAHDSAHSLLTLLNDILDFSKLESGKFSIEQEPFDLRETVDETMKALSTRAFEKGLEIACELDSKIPDELIGDSVRIRQILTNLVSNAIKFTDQGEVVLRVESIYVWPQEARLRFLVNDTGVGISRENQQRILEPFVQVDASSTRRHTGTGLGLSICQELLQLMGARLSIESEPGAGSTFSFQLTLPRQTESSNRVTNAATLDQLNSLHVLVVDDNETNRRILLQTLRDQGMRPEAVQDGEEALGRLRRAADENDRFPLVIVDALMPGMDGYSLSTAIAELFPDNAPPVIMMLSSSDRTEFRQRETESKIKAFLQKPVSQSDLLSALVRALELGPASQTLVEGISANAPLPRSTNGPLSVLLAEDTPANQKVVASILKRRGHMVTVAQNGREAVEMFKRGGFDVVLMDVQMPIMDGFQCTATIRAMERGTSRPTPIIAMTAHAMRGDREKCLEAGMDAYLAKPLDVDEVLAVVEDLGGRQASGRNSPAELPEQEVVDVKATLRRLGNDRALFREFIGFYQEDAPTLVERIHSAAKANNAAELQRAAHSLKGLSGNIGALGIVAAAAELEEAARTDALDDLPNLLLRLDSESKRLQTALIQLSHD